MTGELNPVYLVLGIAAAGRSVLLALVPGRFQIMAAQAERARLPGHACSRAAASSSCAPRRRVLIFIDDFNIYLVVLTAFVGFTTSVFSAGYIRHELEIGRLDAAKLRFYHAMYQAFIFTMLLALVANNLGVMWVAVEGATLTTALMICALSHARVDRGGLEIFHPLRRRHRARALRHHPHVSRRPAGDGQRPGGHGLGLA